MRWACAAALLVATAAFAEPPSALVAARPYHVRLPKGLAPKQPAPLLLLLHPYYPGDGRGAIEMLGVAALADRHGLIVAAPDGTLELGKPNPNRFWNAGPGCCDFQKRGPDDVAYLAAVVADVQTKHAIDPDRLYVLGYSNGGYMTHRLLCERASLFRAGVSIAGAAGPTGKGAPQCKPAQAAALLEIHGDADARVPYAGGKYEPSAPAAIAGWATRLGCPKLVRAPSLDLLPGIPGAETDVTRYECPRGAAELWTIKGGGHRDAGPATMAAAIDFLLRPHPR